MQRSNKVFEHVNRAGRGLEFGPSYNPLAPKSEGFDVVTIDHAIRDELVGKDWHANRTTRCTPHPKRTDLIQCASFEATTNIWPPITRQARGTRRYSLTSLGFTGLRRAAAVYGRKRGITSSGVKPVM